MKWKPYPKYKESGVNWLGEVPEGWAVTRLKYVASLKGRLGWQGLRADEYTEDGPYLVTSEHFSNEQIDWLRCYHVTPDRYAQAPEIQLRPDDLLMMKDGAAMGKLAYVESIPGPACLNSHLLLFRPLKRRFANRFLFFVLGTPSFKAYMAQERTGTTFFGISQESIGSFRLALPPIEQQHQILEHLNRRVIELDSLISKQERLIELLQEKRQALISHAVTKGLNSDAPMKPSGVEWLGEVPEHWKVTRLKYTVPSITVGIVVTPAKYYVDEGVPCLRSLNISSKVINTENFVYISPEANKLLRKSQIRAGDVVVVRTGQTGTAAVVTADLDGANCIDLLIIRRSGLMAPEFLCHFLNSEQTIAQVEAVSEGAIQSHYNTSTLSELKVCVPPIREQIDILDFLDRGIKRIDTLLTRTQAAISLMREHRTALISAAVTGKIDVRETQPSAHA